MPDVQAAAHGRRRGVDRVDVLARLGAVEARRCPRPSSARPTCPRAPRAQACRVRRRRVGLRWSSSVAWLWVSVMGEILGRRGGRPRETGCRPLGARSGLTSRMVITLRVHRRSASFLAEAGAHLAADPVLTTVIATVTRGRRSGRSGRPADGAAPLVGRSPATSGRASSGWRCGPRRSRRTRCTCCRCRTTPRVALARALHERGEEVGRRQRCAAGRPGWSPRRPPGWRAARRRVHEHLRLFELGDLLVPPASAPAGCGRHAATTPTSCCAWFHDFESTPPSRPAATGAHGMRESFTLEDMLAADRRRRGLAVGGRARRAGAPDRRQPAGVRRHPDRPGLHPARAPRPRLRQPRRRRGLPDATSTRACAAACSPTRPTRPRTRSTRRSATARSSTWPTWSVTTPGATRPGPA